MIWVNWTRLICVALALMSSSAHARLTHLIIEERQQVPPGKQGGPAYEILRGHYEGELDPADKHNRVITDIGYAKRQSNGKVGYSATFAIALPLDGKAASGCCSAAGKRMTLQVGGPSRSVPLPGSRSRLCRSSRFQCLLRYSDADDAGIPNPVAHLVRWSTITGTSQS